MASLFGDDLLVVVNIVGLEVVKDCRLVREGLLEALLSRIVDLTVCRVLYKLKEVK